MRFNNDMVSCKPDSINLCQNYICNIAGVLRSITSIQNYEINKQQTNSNTTIIHKKIIFKNKTILAIHGLLIKRWRVDHL